MLLPNVNIKIDPKYIVGACALLTVAGLIFYLGMQFTKGAYEDKITSLKSQLGTSNTQISSLEVELSSTKDLYTVECVKREKEICSDLVKKTIDNIKKLRCKICKAKRRP